MKKRLKITITILVSFGLLMFLLPFALQGRISKTLKEKGHEKLNAQFDFKRVDISLFRNFPKVSVILEDFYLKGIDDFAYDTLIQIPKATAVINIFSLLRNNEYDISNICIEDARIHGIVLPNNQANWDIIKSDTVIKTKTGTNAKTARPTHNIKLQHLSFENLDLIYDNKKTNKYVSTQGINISYSGDSKTEGSELHLKSKAKALTYKINKVTLLYNAKASTDINIDTDFVNRKFILKNSTFQINAVQASLDGWIAFKDTGVNLDLKLNTDDIKFKDLLSLTPTIYDKRFSCSKTEGTARLTAFAKGKLHKDTVPAFGVDLTIEDGMIHGPSPSTGIEHINVNICVQNHGGNIDKTIVNIQPISFHISKNPFSFTATIKSLKDPDFNVRTKGIIDLSMLQHIYPIIDTPLSGVIKTDIEASGKLSDIEKELYNKVKMKGTMELNNLKVTMNNMPDIDIKNSLLTLTPQYVLFSQTNISMGNNNLSVNCHLKNYMGYLLKRHTVKGTLDIQSNLLNLNELITGNNNKNGNKNNSSTDTLSITVAETKKNTVIIPENIDIQLNAKLNQVSLDKTVFDNVNGEIHIKNGIINMKGISCNLLEGNIAINGHYATTNMENPKLKANLKLTNISFQQSYKEVEMIRKLAPVFENINGYFSGDIHIETQLDKNINPILETMQGKGTLEVHDISLNGVEVINQIAHAIRQPDLKHVEIKDTKVNFTLQNGRIATEPFDIRVGEYILNLSGSTGLDQTIDYTGTLKIPISNQQIAIGLKINGQLSSPNVSIDKHSLTNQAIKLMARKFFQ